MINWKVVLCPGRFVIDFLSVFPFAALPAAGSNVKVMRLVRLARLMKLLRVLRTLRILEKYAAVVSSTKFHVALTPHCSHCPNEGPPARPPDHPPTAAC